MKKRTLTIPEAAQELGISERAVWQRVYRRQIPFRRWGKKVIVLAEELDVFIKSLPGTTAEEAVTKTEETTR